IEVQVRENRRGGDRVCDVGFAREAFLALVGRGAKLGRLTDALNLLRRQVGLDVGDQLLKTGRAPSAGEQSQERRRIVHRGGCRCGSVSEAELRSSERGLMLLLGQRRWRGRLRLTQNLRRD